MITQIARRPMIAPRASELEQIEAHVQSKLNGHLRHFHIRMQSDGLVLRGHSRTYYAKQLAQHAVMKATDIPILRNEIEVV